MRTTTFSAARANLAATFDAVINDAEEMVITRSGHEPVVVLSLREYDSMRETNYLLRSPANSERLLEAIHDLDAGHGVEHDLVDTDSDDLVAA